MGNGDGWSRDGSASHLGRIGRYWPGLSKAFGVSWRGLAQLVKVGWSWQVGPVVRARVGAKRHVICGGSAWLVVWIVVGWRRTDCHVGRAGRGRVGKSLGVVSSSGTGTDQGGMSFEVGCHGQSGLVIWCGLRGEDCHVGGDAAGGCGLGLSDVSCMILEKPCRRRKLLVRVPFFQGTPAWNGTRVQDSVLPMIPLVIGSISVVRSAIGGVTVSTDALGTAWSVRTTVVEVPAVPAVP